MKKLLLSLLLSSLSFMYGMERDFDRVVMMDVDSDSEIMIESDLDDDVVEMEVYSDSQVVHAYDRKTSHIVSPFQAIQEDRPTGIKSKVSANDTTQRYGLSEARGTYGSFNRVSIFPTPVKPPQDNATHTIHNTHKNQTSMNVVVKLTESVQQSSKNPAKVTTADNVFQLDSCYNDEN